MNMTRLLLGWFPRTSASIWQQVVLFGIAYFTCAELSDYLSVKTSPFVTFWLPGGLYVGFLLLNEYRLWPWLILAAFPANLGFDLLHGTPFFLTLGFYAANTVQSVMGAYLVRRFIARFPTLATLKEFAGLVGFSALFSPLFGALIGTTALTLSGFSHDFGQTWLLWWSDNAMSGLLVTPLILTWFAKPYVSARFFCEPKKLVEAILLFASLGILTCITFSSSAGIMSLNKSRLIPLLLWVGLRFGARGASLAILLVSLLMAYFTTQSLAGLSDYQITSGEFVLSLQTSLAVGALVGLIPAIVIAERDLTLAKLNENQRRLSTLLSNLPGLVYRCKNDPDWTMEFISEGCRELTGHTPEELQDNRGISFGQLIHAEDQALVWDTVQAAVREQKPFELMYRIQAADGAEKWVWERGRGIFSDVGELLALEGFVTDITARRQAELERAKSALREEQAHAEYTMELIASQEAERTRIAAELHDSLGQNLMLVKNHAQLALLQSDIAASTREQLERISTVAMSAINEVRHISHALHPYQLDHLGLSRSLQAMINNAAESSGINFKTRLDDADEVFSKESALNLYRIVQECLTNILKHSRATHAHIDLACDVHEIELLITDDGCGFAEGEKKGLGLKNITERARLLNGRLQIVSSPGQGTRIEINIPITLPLPGEFSIASETGP